MKVVFVRNSAKIGMMPITDIAVCKILEQMNNNVDRSLVVGVLCKLLPLIVNDEREKTLAIGRNSPIPRRNGKKLEPFASF